MTQTAAERAEVHCGREDGATRQRNGVRHIGRRADGPAVSVGRRAEPAVGEWDASHSVVSEGRLDT
jgi:hypothetical protein